MHAHLNVFAHVCHSKMWQLILHYFVALDVPELFLLCAVPCVIFGCTNEQAGHVMDALLSCKISERQVCVKWWKLGRWIYGFRMRDESHSRMVTLADLLTNKGGLVLGVLRRGAIHEVLRVEICIPNVASTPWSWRSSQQQNQGYCNDELMYISQPSCIQILLLIPHGISELIK